MTAPQHPMGVLLPCFVVVGMAMGGCNNDAETDAEADPDAGAQQDNTDTSSNDPKAALPPPKVGCTADDNPPLWFGDACVVDSACSNACNNNGFCRQMAPHTPQQCTITCRLDSDCPSEYSCRADPCNEVNGQSLSMCIRPVTAPPATCSTHEDCGGCGVAQYCVPTTQGETVLVCRSTCTNECPNGYVCAVANYPGIPDGVKICRPVS